MSIQEKTKRLARLIGLDYHASDVKQKVWRQVKRIRFQTQRGHGWTPWRPHKCEADLEPIKAWLKRRHPDWPRTTGCDGEREHCEAFCDAVLAAFDKQHEPNAPAEHNDAMRDSIGTHSDAITSELLPYGTAAKNRRQFQRLSRLRCAAERRARYFDSTERCEACRSEWRERARIAMGVAEYWKKRYYTVNATNTALGNLRDRAKKAEAECDKLRDQVDDAKHGTELAESALAGERQEVEHLRGQLADAIERAEKTAAINDALRQRCHLAEDECDKLREALADADRDECCAEYKAQQRAEIERLTAALARATADAETYLRIAKSRGTENEILKAALADHLHRIELAESALADKRRECLGLHEELVRITGEIAAGDTSGEIERLRGDVGFFKGALERAGAAHKDAIQLLTETEADRDRLQAALSGRHRR